MTATVELPIWLFVLILVFAAVTFASHFLFPSVRWFFRRRMERVVSQLNERLERPIEPFKLARRYDMIQRLIYDPEVSRAVADYAKARGVPDNVAFEQAKRYAREIVPGFSASLYFGFATRAAQLLSRTLYRVQIGNIDEVSLRNVDENATIVFVMNHRSNMDYVLVTWLAAERSALSYAIGEWARIWPLSGLFRAMGGYFIRRKSLNDLYRRVLARYVGMATDGGVTQAVFPEGGLSLDGGLAPPKLGLLKYIVEERMDHERDVVFVPVALNYDRVFEDRVLVAAGKAGKRRFGARITVVVGFIVRQFWLWITRRYHRHGYAAVSFGAPVSLNAHQADHPGAAVDDLGARLMQRIGEEVPVLPVPLVAQVLVAQSGPIEKSKLIEAVHALVEALPKHCTGMPHQDPEAVVQEGLRTLLRRGLLQEGPDGIEIKADEADLLTYYARSIAHLVDKQTCLTRT